MCFDNAEKFRKQRNGGIWISKPHPWLELSQPLALIALTSFRKQNLHLYVTSFFKFRLYVLLKDPFVLLKVLWPSYLAYFESTQESLNKPCLEKGLEVIKWYNNTFVMSAVFRSDITPDERFHNDYDISMSQYHNGTKHLDRLMHWNLNLHKSWK